MAKCPWTLRVSTYIDHELPSGQSDAVRQHLESCVVCARAAASYGDFRRRALRVADADGMVLAVRRRLGEYQPQRRLFWLLPAALTLLLLVVGTGWYLEGSGQYQAQTEEVIESYIAVAGGF